MAHQSNQTKPNQTKQALMESFKEIFENKPFRKITIKMITDGADVIRPTFYNYFPDKYALVEEILKNELFDAVHPLLELGMTEEAGKYFFTYVSTHARTFKKAFAEIQGQNSFASILENGFKNLIYEFTDDGNGQQLEDIHVPNKQLVIDYYSYAAVLFIYLWINDSKAQDMDSEDVYHDFVYVSSHSLEEVLRKRKKQNF